jgi:hypothetical protein
MTKTTLNVGLVGYKFTRQAHSRGGELVGADGQTRWLHALKRELGVRAGQGILFIRLDRVQPAAIFFERPTISSYASTAMRWLLRICKKISAQVDVTFC